MATRKLAIQYGNRKKEFDLTPKRYSEVESLLEYYNYDFCLEDYIFVYSNRIIFDIIDLCLSSFSTPQPAKDSYHLPCI